MSSSDESSSDVASLDEEATAEAKRQLQQDHRNVKLLLKAKKWSRRLKTFPRILIWKFTTGGREGRYEIVDTVRLIYMRRLLRRGAHHSPLLDPL